MYIGSKVCRLNSGDYKEFTVNASDAFENPVYVANACTQGLVAPNDYPSLLAETIRTVCRDKLRNGALHKHVVIAGPKDPYTADMNVLSDFGWIELVMRAIRYQSWRYYDEIFVIHGEPNWKSTDVVIQKFYAMSFIDHYAINIVAHFDDWRKTLGRMIDRDFPI